MVRSPEVPRSSGKVVDEDTTPFLTPQEKSQHFLSAHPPEGGELVKAGRCSTIHPSPGDRTRPVGRDEAGRTRSFQEIRYGQPAARNRAAEGGTEEATHAFAHPPPQIGGHRACPAPWGRPRAATFMI